VIRGFIFAPGTQVECAEQDAPGWLSGGLRPAPALVLGLALALLVAMPGSALAARGPDYGDAPDGRAAGYQTAPLANGSFPSLRASPGPSHRPRGRRLRLGVRWSGEGDSRQVDRDRDDGAMLRVRRCSKRSSVLVLIDARRLPRRFFRKTSRTRIYVNAWFDWNRDGDWAEGTDGCAPEWGVQNLALRPRRLGRDRQGVLPIRLRSGASVDELWWRLTLTLGQRVSSAGGGGLVAGGEPRAYRFGETEDFHHLSQSAASSAGSARAFGPLARSALAAASPPAQAASPDLAVICEPNPLIMEHGTTARTLALAGGDDQPRRVRLVSPHGSKSVRIRAPQRTGLNVVVKSLQRHPRDPRVEAVTYVILWRLKDEKAESVCEARIEHEEFLPAKTARQPDQDGDQGPGGGGGMTKCSDGMDNDSDGLTDGADPGCRTGPGGTYDSQDHGEDDFVAGINCASAGQTMIMQNNVGTTMVRHLLTNVSDGGALLIERASGDADFASGSTPVSLCSGATTSVSWQVSGLTVTYTIVVGAGGTGTKQVRAAADTR